MEKKELEKILEKAPIENEQWDFKREWHHSNGELLRDILNFVNTPNHENSYIIFGISDDDGSIIGVNNDTNRRNKQNIQDYLRNQHFSQNYYPNTNVESFDFDGKFVDVLIIYNTNKTPLFLTDQVKRVDNKTNKAIGKPLERGRIYSRIGDSNTPVDESTTDERMKELWQKRFRLDTNIYDRAKFILKDYNNWSHIKLTSNDNKYIYTKDPDFIIDEVVDEDGEYKDRFTSFTLDQPRTKIYWYKIKLKLRGTSIYEGYYLYINGTEFGAIIPNRCGIELPRLVPNIIASYYYYYENDLSLLLTKLIDHRRNNYKFSSIFSNDKYNNDIIVFENEMERKNIEKMTIDYIYKNFDNTKKRLWPSYDEIKMVENNVKLDMSDMEFKDNKDKIPLYIFENKLTQLMQEIKIMQK